MRFTPKSNEELNSMNLLIDGIYNFEVVQANEKISKSGNDMIELQLKVWDKNGSEHIIYDYLLEAMAYKLRHFAESCDLLHKYENGCLNAEDCIGKCAKVEVIISSGRKKPEGGEYPNKNSVKDYIKPDVTIVSSNEDKFDDDLDLPF